MKPCDCPDGYTAKVELNEQGIGFNDWGILVQPRVVLMTYPNGQIRIPMVHFKRFAEWYLTDQIKTITFYDSLRCVL